MNIGLKKQIVILVASSVIVLASTSSFVVYGTANQEQTTSGEWYEFLLQDCNYRVLKLYDAKEKGNQALSLDVEVNDLTNMKLLVHSRKQIGEKTFSREGFEILKTGVSSFTFESVELSLDVRTTLDGEIAHQITIKGRYRINNGEWNVFNLDRCYPGRLQIFSNISYVHTVLLNLNITSMTTELILDYSYSDFSIPEEILETGSYSYTLNASYISLDLNGNGTVTGLYSIESLGSRSIAPQVSGFLFFAVGLPMILIHISRKNS